VSSCVCSQRGFGWCSLRPKANPALKTSIYFWQTAKFHFDHTNRRTSHLWVYMLLAQFVAVAVASNLFYLTLLLSQSAQPCSIRRLRSLPPQVWLSVLFSLAAIAASPFTSKQIFFAQCSRHARRPFCPT